MTDPDSVNEEETRRLIVAIIDFLREELVIRTDLDSEDRECLEIAIQSLELTYGLEGARYLQYRITRPLRDIFNQVTNPVSVKNKLRADAHKEEGNNYMRRKMYADAEAEYTNAIELDKWNSIYYCNRGSARIEQQRYFEGIADCRQAIMLNPDYARAHGRMGQAYAHMNRHRQAAHCFRQAVQLEPENEKYRHNLRVSENEANRPDPAQLFTNLLASMLGIGPQNTLGSSSNSSPTSFMIITEISRPSSDDALSQDTESSQVSESTPVNDGTDRKTSNCPCNTRENDISINSSMQGNNVFRFPDNVTDEDEGKQSKQHLPLQNLNSQSPNEILTEFLSALGIHFQGSMQSPSSQDDSNLQRTEIDGTKSIENTQKNETQTESETEPNDSPESKHSKKDTLKTGKSDINDKIKDSKEKVTENENISLTNEKDLSNNNPNDPSRSDNYTKNENSENACTSEKDTNDVHDNVNDKNCSK